MGDYNADANPNLEHARQLAFAYRLAPFANLKIDQFSTAGSHKVFSLVTKIGSNRLHVLIDPDLMPE